MRIVLETLSRGHAAEQTSALFFFAVFPHPDDVILVQVPFPEDRVSTLSKLLSFASLYQTYLE